MIQKRAVLPVIKLALLVTALPACLWAAQDPSATPSTEPTRIDPAMIAATQPATITGSADTASGSVVEVLPPVVVTAGGDVRQQTPLAEGSPTYTLGKDQIDTIAQGENTSFNKILIQSPGVAFDTYGAIHFREEDPYYRYYINGTLLPGGINGFSQDIDTRFVDSVSLKVGALTPIYPEGNYGIVDITTKTGSDLKGGAVSLYGGSFNTIHPTFSYGDSEEGTDLYFTTDYVHDNIGLENPTPASYALHDNTNQYRGFLYLSHQFENSGRLSFVLSAADQYYQIPNTPGQTPAFDFSTTSSPPQPVGSTDLNETQNEQTYYELVAYQQTVDDFSYQISQVNRGSTVLFRPDVNGDIYYTGVAARVSNHVVSNSIQADFTAKFNIEHTVRGGMLLDTQNAGSDSNTRVYPTDGNGNPIGFQQSIVDDHSKQTFDYALYLQDQWSVSKRLTVNYGFRFEQIFAYTRGDEIEPRLNAVFKLDKYTDVHAGYARYFDPPQLLNISSGNVQALNNTTNAPDQDTNDPVKPERSHYFDAGIEHTFLPGLKTGVDAYYKIADDQIDDGQFGAANIGQPYNFDRARIYGVQFSIDYTHDGFSAYGNFAAADGWGKGIVSSQFEFDANELVAIDHAWVHLDQSQYFTASAGVAYTWRDTTVHLDAIYGDGIRQGFVNTGKLGPNYPINVGIEQRFKMRGNRNALIVRFDVTNILDKSYILNDGTGIGEGAVKYLNRRGFYGGLTYEF